MIIIPINSIKNILKNGSAIIEKKNIMAIFDLIFIIENNNLVVIIEGITGSCGYIMTINNPENYFCIIKTNINILTKIITNITSDSMILLPKDQSILNIESFNNEPTKKITIPMNFSIYSHNTYINNYEDEIFNKYKIYWDFLINNTIENTNPIIQMESTNKFIEFLKKVNYAASTDNDRAFSNVFFEWQNNQLMANSSNRIRIAIGKINTTNNSPNAIKFSCDKRNINGFIKLAQNYGSEPLYLSIMKEGRIYGFFGKDFVLEMGYSVKRSININEFFSALENSYGFLCNVEEFKQGIQCAKSFATKFHYSILLTSQNNDEIIENPNHQIRIFFQEPNHGNIETFINDYFNNTQNFSVEVNVIYLWDAIMSLNTKQCLLMINIQQNYLFVIPWSENSSIENIKDTYQEAHLIMCLR